MGVVFLNLYSVFVFVDIGIYDFVLERREMFLNGIVVYKFF